MSDDDGRLPPRSVRPEHVRRIRAGHGANCSSIGSVVDTLFATATLGSALFVAIAAALAREPVHVVEPPDPDGSPSPDKEAR